MKDTTRRDKTGIKGQLEYANSIIATLREPFLVLDKELRVISANQAFYTTFKVAEEDTIGQLLTELGDGQWNIPELLQLLRDIAPEGNFVKDYEVKRNFKRIGKRVMVLNARQLRLPGPPAATTPPGARKKAKGEDEEELILIAIADITQRRRLQEELEESEERYRRVFETSRTALLLVHKTKAHILNSNETAQELLGYSPEEFLNKKLWDLGVTTDDKDFRDTVSRLERDGVIHYDDTPLRTKKGPRIDTEVFLVDKAKVIQCSIRSITQRKEAEDALKASEMRFKAIFNESTDGMLLTEVETRRFFMCNPAICQMLGYAEEELLRLGANDIHPQTDVQSIIEQFERQAKGELRTAPSLPVKRKDGSVFYADVNTSRITLTGKSYLLRSFTDTTDSKRIQDELGAKMRDLERFSRFAVDRELKMEELEGKVKELENRLKTK